jgi:hypothetical protein
MKLGTLLRFISSKKKILFQHFSLTRWDAVTPSIVGLLSRTNDFIKFRIWNNMFPLLIWVFGRTKHHSSGMMVDFSSEIRAGVDTKSQTAVAQGDTSVCAVQMWWGLPKWPFILLSRSFFCCCYLARDFGSYLVGHYVLSSGDYGTPKQASGERTDSSWTTGQLQGSVRRGKTWQVQTVAQTP